ncbi:coiled-coil domain-containing protein 57-like [Ruditapes philippinarum]|uniref:coiled-coil domain-containing protein 57-like n=1 Tax=Ruditapes philippinarum TaxID=129788 RepID=UPI00295B1ADD|nr:coiled-coil domain-containing protein 57-like [Ruditapes philippinarum]XP_060556178.1 coiled-coil domain-containing protein 57-like [Ruditapes philippinarum]
MDGGTNEADHWREVAAQKEKEWKQVTEQRINALEHACQEKDKQLTEEREKFHKLKEDFKYNLKLLEQRDQELDRYDATFSDIKAQLNMKNAEVSECKIHVDELKTQVNCEIKSREELQLHYQSRLREKQAEIDSYRNTKDGEIQEERKEFESFKRKLQRQLTQLEEEMDAQKRELTLGFEEAMRKREHEFRIQADEMSAKVLEHELKAKLLSKELDLVRSAQEKNSQEFEHVENNHRALEKKLKEKDWELQDMRAMKDANISDLENQVQQTESAMKRLQEDFERKHSEMDKYCREKEAALSTAKEAIADRESELQKEIRDLTSKLEDANVEIRKLQWARQDLEKEKNSYIEKLQAQSQELKDKWDKQIVQVSRNQVGKDIELQNMRETEEKLRLEIIQKKEDIERYKKELSCSVEREASLERSKAQMELDWQRRYEDLERQQYERSEDLVKKLTRARDEAQATVKEKQRELQQRDAIIKVLKTDRQQAFETLKRHGIQVDKNIKIDIEEMSMATDEEMQQLREQNENLKMVIREMRSQMEQLGHDIPVSNVEIEKDKGCSEDYVSGLEKECRNLRKRNRELEQDADVSRRFGRAAPPVQGNEEEVLTEVKDNMLVKNHIQSLNEIIGGLRGEKVDLSAQLKKQQAHVLFQEKNIENIKKQQREKQVELEQLQYELGAASRRSQTEVTSLRQKVSELELQLLETRKEADEYYRSNLERNMEVTSLGQELSNLKIQLAEKRPGINFGAQELLIQQLQDEIMSLKKQGAEFMSNEHDDGRHGQNKGSQVQALQQKLRNAARKIMELAKEKQQLIEMGNKLRSELKNSGIDKPAKLSSNKQPLRILQPPIREEDSDHMTSSQPLSEQYSNKLSQLEKLQYQLTRQELQYAQKFQGKTDEYRPSSILKKSSAVRDSMDTEIDVRASMNTEGGETVASMRSVPDTVRSQLMMSMSSMGGESLQEVWKMLEDGRPSPTPRLSSPQRRSTQDENYDSNEYTKESLYLSGKHTGYQRPKSEKKLSEKASGKVFKKVQHKQPTVRNYNIKDDRSSR